LPEPFNQYLLVGFPSFLGARSKVHESVSPKRGRRVQSFFPATSPANRLFKATRTGRIIDLTRAVKMPRKRSGPVTVAGAAHVRAPPLIQSRSPSPFSPLLEICAASSDSTRSKPNRSALLCASMESHVFDPGDRNRSSRARFPRSNRPLAFPGSNSNFLLGRPFETCGARI
jgi:hypothetical protein